MKLASSQQRNWSPDWGGQTTVWKIFASFVSDKGLITKIHRDLKKLTAQRMNNPLNKWASELNRQFSKE
jgi:hypothetical protein